MNKKKLLLTVGLVFIFSIITLFVHYETANASWDLYIVQIKDVKTVPQEGTDLGKTLRIKPRDNYISEGDVVVWINRSNMAIKVIFREGKTCKISTESPSGFAWDSLKECFVTNELAKGATSSIRYTAKGVYEYEIEALGGKIIKKGKIVVE